VDDDPVELDDLVLTGERVVGLELERATVTGANIDGCDLSGVLLSSYAVRRSKVMRTRLRDCILAGGIVQDTEIAECPTERLSLRFSTLQRVTFTDCQLPAADFYGAVFDKVTFTGCDLSGAHFDNATVKELVLQSCTLLGVTGALSLRGAVVDIDDLPGLAPSLAREAGLKFSAD
jgi:uncharacterized protein YjbI with pentapeptide repeats